MTTRPDELEWASDENYDSGPAEGTPTKLEPSNSAKEQGFEPDEAAEAQAVNWALNLLAQWTSFFKGAMDWAGAQFHQLGLLSLQYGWSTFYYGERFIPLSVESARVVAGSPDFSGSSGGVQVGASDAIEIEATPDIGVTITGYQVRYRTDMTGAGDAIQLREKRTSGVVYPDIQAYDDLEDDGSWHTLTVTELSENVTISDRFSLRIDGRGAGSGTSIDILGVHLIVEHTISPPS